MKTFTSKEELIQLIKGYTLFLYLGYGSGFIQVTNKAVKDFIYTMTECTGTYETTGSIMNFGFKRK